MSLDPGYDLFDMVAELCETNGLGTPVDGDALIFPTPGDLAKYIDPRTVQTPALDILDAALIDAANGVSPRLIFTMPPQEGKSQRVSRTFPLWLLLRNSDLRIGVVSYAQTLAVTASTHVRRDIESHPELRLRIGPGQAAKSEWTLDGVQIGPSMIARGVGGGLTGKPLDVLIIDDPFADRKQADSELIRQNVWDWWTEVGSARLGPNAIVVVIMTRWHEDDLAGRMLKDAPDIWRHINIPARADHDPNKGEADILGRRPGEYMVSARGRSQQDWEQRERTAGSRSWTALYQGRPSPGDGGVFRRAWWRFYSDNRYIERANGSMYIPGQVTVELHVDCAFKDIETSDYVAMGVWVRRGPRVWLADLVNEHLDVIETVQEILTLRAKWPQINAVVVEDKANGPAVIQILRRKVPGVIEYTPLDSKQGRAFAVTPLIEAGDVELPDPQILPKISQLLEQCASFPVGAHDDLVDQMTQALDRMLLKPAGDPFMRALLAEQGAEILLDRPQGAAWSPQGGFADNAPEHIGNPFA